MKMELKLLSDNKLWKIEGYFDFYTNKDYILWLIWLYHDLSDMKQARITAIVHKNTNKLVNPNSPHTTSDFDF